MIRRYSMLHPFRRQLAVFFCWALSRRCSRRSAATGTTGYHRCHSGRRYAIGHLAGSGFHLPNSWDMDFVWYIKWEFN